MQLIIYGDKLLSEMKIFIILQSDTSTSACDLANICILYTKCKGKTENCQLPVRVWSRSSFFWPVSRAQINLLVAQKNPKYIRLWYNFNGTISQCREIWEESWTKSKVAISIIEISWLKVQKLNTYSIYWTDSNIIKSVLTYY